MADQRFARRDVLLTGLAAAAVPPLAHAQPTPELSFLVLGDWGRRGAEDQPAVARQLRARALQTHSSFVVTVGDNFYQDGVGSTTDPHWKASFRDVYDLSVLKTWYPALGNHDYHDQPDAQIAYSQVDSHWQMPARHYRKRVMTSAGRKVDLFIIDTSPIAEPQKYAHKAPDTAIQKQWLKTELATSDADWKLVFGHHTVATSGISDRDYPLLRNWLVPLLKDHGAQAYVCGHDHHLEHIVHNGLNCIVTGGGSQGDGLKDQKVAGHIDGWATAGFTSYRIAGDTLTVDYISKTGQLLRSIPVPRQALVPA